MGKMLRRLSDYIVHHCRYCVHIYVTFTRSKLHRIHSYDIRQEHGKRMPLIHTTIPHDWRFSDEFHVQRQVRSQINWQTRGVHQYSQLQHTQTTL